MVESMRLDVSAVSVWCWRPGRFLESYWSSVYIGIPKKRVQIPAEETTAAE